MRIAPPGGGGGGGSGEGGGAGASGGASMATSKAVAGMIATFIAGGLIGAAVMHSPAPRPIIAGAAVTSRAPASAPPAASALPVDDGLDLVEAATATPAPVSASAPLVPRPASAPTEDASSAAAERALLDAARIALASGEPERAIDVVDRHAREYPHGRLAEEREAIAVRALVKVGRYDEARTRAARFQSLYPRSVAAPAVSGAIRSIP
jgi:TolA-binding protein